MKAVLKYLLVSLLISTYCAGMIGVGVYSCPGHCSHSGKIVLLASGDCNCRHNTPQHCCAHNQNQPKKKHCCDIKYQVLQLDQEVNHHSVTFKNHNTADFFFLPVRLITISAPRLVAEHNHDPPPLGCLSSPDIFCLSQLRL